MLAMKCHQGCYCISSQSFGWSPAQSSVCSRPVTRLGDSCPHPLQGLQAIQGDYGAAEMTSLKSEVMQTQADLAATRTDLKAAQATIEQLQFQTQKSEAELQFQMQKSEAELQERDKLIEQLQAEKDKWRMEEQVSAVCKF